MFYLIQFLLNHSLQQEDNIDPNTTVLQYLREYKRKTGTKEGCASGDCGACTVVLAELDETQTNLTYRSINSCLTFIATLHGKQLITVEDLQHKQQLHNTQQAMADCHASQCGFCTPGFVMSLFALQKNCQSYDRDNTIEALSGNLCRCTGYRPIYMAAEQACNTDSTDQFDYLEAQTIERLKAIQASETATLHKDEKQCFLPTSVEELADLYIQYPDAYLFAGGTDLALEVTQFHRSLATSIYLGQIASISGVTINENFIEIGAATPLTQCYQTLQVEYPDFGELLHRFASLQIRNQGTLGGNIGNASPIGDSPPLLIALDSQIQLRQGENSRVISLEGFFIDYKKTARQTGEFIEKILIPRRKHNQLKAYKVSKRLDDDISAVCAAFNITIKEQRIESVRIAFGGMAATPKRALHCEQALLNQPMNDDIIQQACDALGQDFTPLNDFRASAEYRLLCAQNLLKKCFIELNQQKADRNHYFATRVFAHG